MNPKFYIQRFLCNGQGLGVDHYVSFGDVVSIEDEFSGVRYKSVTGLDSYGEPKIYVEEFADSDGSLVYVPQDGDVRRKQTDVTLSLCFFGDKSDESDEESMLTINSSYERVVNFFSGCYVSYHDTVRKRKVLMYLSSGVTVKSDKIYGMPYKQVDFKFKNVFGKSFDVDHTF